MRNLKACHLGTAAKPRLFAKAAQTYGLCCFLVERLPSFQDKLGSDFKPLHEAGQQLVDIIELFRMSKTQVPTAVVQMVLDKWKRFVRLSLPWEIVIPKTT